MSLLQKIIARGARGRATLNTAAHAQPTNDLGIVPDWEGLALVALPALIVFGICLADMLR